MTRDRVHWRVATLDPPRSKILSAGGMPGWTRSSGEELLYDRLTLILSRNVGLRELFKIVR